MRETARRLVTIEQAETRVTCDLCGIPGNLLGDMVRWPTGSGTRVSETCCRWRFGFECPDGGNGKEYLVDICPVCFEEKLLLWMRTQSLCGVIAPTEWDW